MSKEPFGKQSIRKIMMVEGILLLTIYMALKFLYNWRNKGGSSEGLRIAKESASQEHQQPATGSKKASILDFDVAFLDQQFRVIFLNHLICMGFSLLYSAHAVELVICFLHFIGFACLIVFKIKDMEFYYNATFCVCQALNLSLVLTGLIGMDP